MGQGCPAAASAFVIGIHPLLTAIHSRLDVGLGEALSAFADDIAVVLRCVSRLNVLSKLFKEFELASALCLNFKKTVIVPLSSACPLLAVAAIKAQIAGTALADVCVAPNAVLISIPIGRMRSARKIQVTMLGDFGTWARAWARLTPGQNISRSSFASCVPVLSLGPKRPTDCTDRTARICTHSASWFQ